MGQVDTSDCESVFTNKASNQGLKPQDTERAALPAATMLGVINGPDQYNTSAEYVGNPRKLVSAEHNINSYSSGFPHHPTSESLYLRGGGANTPLDSPHRGRSRKVTHIPVSAQHSMYKDMNVRVTYRGGQVPWVPPMPSTPPPPPPHAEGSLEQYLFPGVHMPTSQHVPVPNLGGSLRRRLSIPPSTILRPFMEHGRLPLSPTKAVESDLASATCSQQTEQGGQSQGGKRTETGGFLKNVMAKALKRRMTDGNVRAP
jgi:hypothetical protein